MLAVEDKKYKNEWIGNFFVGKGDCLFRVILPIGYLIQWPPFSMYYGQLPHSSNIQFFCTNIIIIQIRHYRINRSQKFYRKFNCQIGLKVASLTDTLDIGLVVKSVTVEREILDSITISGNVISNYGY